MTADLFLHNIAALVTPGLAELRIVPNAAIAVRNGLIAWRGPIREWIGKATADHDCKGSAVVPALVDPHTHAIWAGDRLGDFEARLSGVSYEEILRSGGGIRRTVRATAAASPEELVALSVPRIEKLMRSGVATVEVKSGYGLDPDAELRILEAIALLANRVKTRIVPTLLLHLPGHLEQICHSLIPEVASRGLARAVDIFVEREAWTVDDARTIVRAANHHGLPFKLHTEQFRRVGGLELGISEGALSVDHLEACAPEQLALFAESATVATILPGVTLHLGLPAAPGRALIDAGATVAVGTDLNPGSSPLFSMQMALALATRLNGLTPAEALLAGTVNAATALGLRDCGRVEFGMRADFLVLESGDWRDLVYTLGADPIREVWIEGQLQ